MSKEEKAKEILKLHFGSSYVNTFIEPEDEECTVNAMIEFSDSQLTACKEALRETTKELEQVFLDWYPYDDETEIHRIGAIVDKAKKIIK